MTKVGRTLSYINTSERKKASTEASTEKMKSSRSVFFNGGGGEEYLLKSVWNKAFEFRKDLNGNEYLFGKLPLVLQYGLTMYADNGADIPTLAEGLPFDQRTIWFNPETGQIEVIGGTGGGVSNFWDLSGIPSWITNTKPVYNYSEIKNTPDLSGYATTSSLNAVSTKLNDFLEGSDTDTVINKWKELETFLSGLSESDNLATILTGKADKSYVDTNFVTIAGTEDVTGVHDFVNGLKIGNIKLSKSQEGVVYLEGNLVVKGGVTMYALDKVTVDSIIDSLPLASTSQYGIAKFNPSNFVINEDGFVTIIGGSSGLDTKELAEYLTTNKYATQGWVEGKGYITSSALNGYATQSWVTNQKYITGITSAMVVSALGFTPYNSANFTKANIKSTLGISDWALASTKPSYNFSEIGAKPTTIAGYGITDAYTKTEADELYANYLPLAGAQMKGDIILPNRVYIRFALGDSSNPAILGFNGVEYLVSGNNYATNIRSNGTLTHNDVTIWDANTLTSLSQLTNDADFTTNAYVNNTFVTIGTKQTITGEKNFTGGLRVNNSPSIYYDETNKYWKLEGDLLVTGGVSMYSDDTSYIPSTIMDAVVVDGVTIKKRSEDGALYFAGTMDGGVTDFWELNNIPTWIGSSKPTYTLGSLQNVDSSSIDATATVDRVLFQQAGSATWVTKPLSEIGGGSSGGGSVSGNYLPLSGGTINGSGSYSAIPLVIKNTNSQFNGLSIYANTTERVHLGYWSSLGGVRLENVACSAGLSILNDKTPSYYKINSDGTFTKNTILHAGNYPSYALPLSGGTINGELMVNGTFQSGYAMISSNRIDPLHVNNSTSGASHSCMLFYTNGTLRSQFGYAGGGTYYYNYASDSYIRLLDAMEGSTRYIEVSDNIYIGTANRRNLLGIHPSYLLLGYSAMEANIPTYIDGAEIYLRYGANWSNVVHLKSNNSVQIPGVLYFGEHDKTNDTSTNIGYIGRGSTDNRMILYCEGDAHIYSKGVEAVIVSSTNMLVYGGITMYSDQRKKTILNHVELSLKQIADAPLIEHYYNSDQEKTTHVGSIAQYWAGLNDWFCKLDAEGYYTMEIQNCALASAISIARHLEKYESKTDKKIRQLKKRISQLEDELELLKKGV